MSSITRSKLITTVIALPVALAALLYGGGILAQFIRNYQDWQDAGGNFGTAPALPETAFLKCVGAVFTFPYGLYGIGACLGCVTKTKEPDEHTHVNNTRICVEGPVFDASVVDI